MCSSDLRERAPINFEIVAVNLDQKQPNFPADVLPAYLEKLGVPFHIENQDTYSIVKRLMSLPDGQEITFDLFYDAGMFYIGDPDTVAEKLKGFWDEVGGFGTLMYVAGKGWADRERRHRSMKLFMEQVAPQLRGLEPTRQLAS